MEILFLIGRVLFGGFYLANAFNHFTKANELTQYAASKKVPMPKEAVLLSGALLLTGGIAILFGVMVPFGVASVVLFLFVAAFKMHDFWAVSDPMQKIMQMVLFMRNIGLVGASLMVLAIPQPWPLSFGF